MRTGKTVVAPDPCALIAGVAAALCRDATTAPDGPRAALDHLVRALGLRSAVLRDAGGALRAVAGDVVHVVPPRRDASDSVVELPVHGAGGLSATLTVTGSRPGQLPVLRAVCAVLGMALGDPARAAADDLPLVLLQAADADADAAADDLHDGPVQDLVLARLAADMAVRSGDVGPARDAVQAALQSMRRALWLLRPRGAGDGGLAPALRQLSDRLEEAGRPGLVIDVDPGAALGGPAAAVAYRLVQALARVSSAAVAVRLQGGPGCVHLEVRAAGALPAGDRWSARARAAGAVLVSGPDRTVVLRVPTAPPDPADDIEAI